MQCKMDEEESSSLPVGGGRIYLPTTPANSKIVWLGNETEIMRCHRMSLLLPPPDRGVAVEANCVQLEPRDFTELTRPINFPGCRLIKIKVTSMVSDAMPKVCVVAGRCLLKPDEQVGELLAAFKERLYGDWPDCIDICPICAKTAVADGLTEYYILWYPVSRLEPKSRKKVCWEPGIIPRLTCMSCLEGLLEGPRVEVLPHNSSTNGMPLGRQFSLFTGKIPLQPLSGPASDFVKSLHPSYPYLNRTVKLPPFEDGSPVIHSKVYDFRDHHYTQFWSGALAELCRLHREGIFSQFRTHNPTPSNSFKFDEIVEERQGGLNRYETASFHLARCDWCDGIIDPSGSARLVCSKCKTSPAKYCGIQCQKKHWTSHKKLCTGKGHKKRGGMK